MCDFATKAKVHLIIGLRMLCHLHSKMKIKAIAIKCCVLVLLQYICLNSNYDKLKY